MLEPDLIELFVQPLNQLRIRYLISGSVAAMMYGEPRVTHDIDLIAFLTREDLDQLPRAYPAPSFYLPPREVMSLEVARERRGHFNIIHSDTGLKADVYTSGQDELHKWALPRARRYSVGSTEIQLAPPEYVIVRKLEYYREGGSEKHVRDIQKMLAVSGTEVDHDALQEWIERCRLEDEWRKCLEK